MFEGLVRQLLLGYLGRYIKDIHKEQLKITLWNEEVLLENVELILEAFDYLQLPFALNQGRVGRLSIKIPWKKLGWDPIIIILEDVLVCACQRDDKEWSMDAVERREFAGKKAKLAAAELAKLSRRVCDDQAGKSFISYITAKVLDGIQLSIRNVHVMYRNPLSDAAESVFGLRFSSLTVMKQNLTWASTVKARGGQVSKLVEVHGLEIYCSTVQGNLELVSIGNDGDSRFGADLGLQGDKSIYLLAPVDASVSVLVNRSGNLGNDAPQYSINFELAGLAMSLDEVQLQQVLTLYDYLCTCRLREKYGRYRPPWSPLSKRLKGWQTMWWHYAQHSVLSDVRKSLRKTSWKYLGERLTCRRKYVKLYKAKLERLLQEQLVGEDILKELEQMEKEYDIDDILSYRSAAERELQDFLVDSSSKVGATRASTAIDKSLDDERPSSKPSGWLNWLSRGMLGAGGTDDSSQFSGVVSDEVIKDIYEATKFHPLLSANEARKDGSADDKIYVSSIKFSIIQVSATLRSIKFDHVIAELILQRIFVECNIWEKYAAITASVDSAEMLNPISKQVILLSIRDSLEENDFEREQPSLTIQVDLLHISREAELVIKVMFRPLEVTCDSQFLSNVMGFYHVVDSFMFQHERALLSLNGIDDVKARVLSKVEHKLSSRRRLTWDVNFTNFVIIFPWKDTNLELHKVVLESRAISFASKREVGFFDSDIDDKSCVMRNFIHAISASDIFMGFQLQDLYDHFDIKLVDVEMKMSMPYCGRTVPILEKFSASIAMASCIIPDESMLNGLEVFLSLPSLQAHFSPSIYGAIMELTATFDWLQSTLTSAVPTNNKSNGPSTSRVLCYSATAKLDSVSLFVDLENNLENSCTLMLSLQELDTRFSRTELTGCWISAKTMTIITYSGKSKEDGHIICSSENTLGANSAHQHEMGFGSCTLNENCDDKNTSADGCFLLHYEAYRNMESVSHKYMIRVNDLDLHCYPYIIALLVGFAERMSEYGTSEDVEDSLVVEEQGLLSIPGFEFQSFGCSNFVGNGSSEWASIPVDQFPFVTIHNLGSLLNLENSLIYGIPDWRKVLHLRDRKIRSTKFSVKKGSKSLFVPPVRSTSRKDGLHMQHNFDDTNLFLVDLNLSSSRVHFHDSSCIVGTIMLPTSKSSFSISPNSLDVLCSTSGLVLSTSWWTQNLHDFLWGPSSADLSPVLNFRVRKGGSESLRSHFEISFSVQHVCCILPAEFLAILIGYFSLPDWKYDGKEPVTESSEETEDNVMTFKFEILDSTLFVPVEREGPQFLKVDIQQLVCSFIHKSDRHIVLKDIPSECLVPPNKFACKNHCLNLFGRDLSLSVLLPKDDAFGQRDISLIAPLSADVWIRIPRDCESSSVSPFAPTCIMARVNICQLIAEDNHALVGYEALLAVGDQFSLVHNESQGFTSDILQFLQHKRSIKENSALPPESLNIIFTEIRCSVHTMSIEFYSSRRESISSTLVSKVEMRFTCSASLRDDKPVCLDMSFSSLALFSYLNSVMLAECISPCSISSILDIKMSVSAEGTHRLYVSLPSLDIWLYLSDWSEVIDLLSSYPRSKTSTVNASVEKSNVGPVGQIEVPKYSPPRSGMSSSFALENMKQDVVFIGRSENVGITIHIPVKVNGEAFRIFQEPEVRQERPLNDTCKAFGGNQYGFIVVTFCSRCVELLNNGDLVRLNSNFEKTSGTVEVQFEKTVRTWPFFQLSHFNLEAEIWDHAAKQVHGIVDVRCDSLDVWLSHHIFSFWGCMLFEFPKAGSSEFAFSGLDLSVRLRKLSLLITDGKTEPLVKGNFCGIATAVTQSILTSEFCFRSALKVLIEEWRSNGPLLELLTRNVLLHCKATENELEGSVVGELQLNFYNIHKVLWEPFIEPWEFHLSITRRNEQNVLLNSAIFTDINLNSEKQLNLNLTESLIEVAFRASDMIKDALSVQSESPRFSRSQISGNAYNATYAPYMLQNLTSLPLVFHVRQGPITAYDLNVSAFKDEKCLQPGSSIPVFINETPGEQLFRCRPVHSSDRISDKQFMEEGHRYVFIQLEGTSRPSPPISMDLVGLSYVEVDFSKSSQNAENDIVGDELKSNKSFEGNNKADSNSGYVVPVVVDVSIQQYTKIIRLYSTVILLNATSVPFEVRFDIPFGVSPKILDPIHPGKELPLPLHLAETGRMRWRPLGNTYLWSEAYNISNLLSHENKIGFLRSFICYPSHPSSDPFRCCISVYNISATLNQSVENSGPVIHNADKSAKRYIHLVTLSSPFVVKNYLPVAFSLAIESGGVTRTALLSEVESTFFHIDYSHDLAITFNMHGFRPSHLKFPRAETFGATAKFSGSKFSLFETITFCSDLSDGPLCVTVEKVMDAFSGAREICLSVPFLLYNCTGFSIILSNCVDEMKGRGCTLPSCYDLDEQDLQLGKKDGLGLLSSNQYLPADARNDRLRNSSLNDHIVSTRKNVDTHPNYYTSKALNFSGTCKTFCRGPEKHDLDSRKSNLKSPGFEEVGYKKANARMYSPDSGSSASELTVRVCRDLSERVRGNIPNYSWSTPFLLVPPTGSTSVLVPQPTPNAAYVISVASSAASGPLCEKTRIISFQPRYVISNACSKDICYKQKGTDFSFHLWIGQHSHIHWTDTTRELLVSVRFNKPGWQWSGCFLPEHLGDTQLKMRNYVTGAVNMIRIEVQNADVSIRDEKVMGSPHGNYGTNLILLSDDDTGFMPYRIDNFSRERLRIYQQRCETLETVVHSYTSCPYAWDEPCYAHRLTVEVPGERVIGSYTLDDVKEYAPVRLHATSEKPERTLLVSVHAEGALKVLSVIDSSSHILNDVKGSLLPRFKGKGKCDHNQAFHCKERISVSIPFIGISVMNSYPQELLFASVKNTTIDLVRSLDQQKFSFQVSSLQIDNQLHSTPYPVILYFDRDYKANPISQIRSKDDTTTVISADSSNEPVLSLAAAIWNSEDMSLISFEFIHLRVADLHLELEQEVILSFSDFLKTISSRLQSGVSPYRDPTLLSSDFNFVNMPPTCPQTHALMKANGDKFCSINGPIFTDNWKSSALLPSIVPIGAPWQQIHLLARKQKKIYVELFDLASFKLTLSFSSTPWMLRNGAILSGESLIHRGLMALADVEGAQIQFKQLVIAHQLASWESINDILIRHYMRQLFHEMYKVFGSAGVIGNPMGFARSVGLGIKDFVSVPARSVMETPAGLITGISQGTTSLLSNTVYAISDAATQFSRAARKGIVAFTFDDQAVEDMEKQQKGVSLSKGVINEFLEGLTGLLQSPIKGAEKHGLPGVFSGIALGVTGLVARPAASILEVTGKTAQSIRNRSKLHHQRLRARLPRPLSRVFPLRPYSWEEAVGTYVLAEADGGLKLKDEILVICKALGEGGKFVIVTERLVLIISCSSLVDLGKPRFQGIPADPEWVIEAEIGMDSVIHADADEEVVHIVGSSSDTLLRQNQHQQKRGGGMKGNRWHNSPTPLPLFQTNLEFTCKEAAENFLQILLSTIEKGKERGWGCVHLLHQSNLK